MQEIEKSKQAAGGDGSGEALRSRLKRFKKGRKNQPNEE